MRFDLVSINWTAQMLTEEQLLVLRNAAALHLKGGSGKSVFYFTHELCEGSVTVRSKGLFVSFVGTFFHADLGLVKGERWTVDFLLPVGSENLAIDDSSIVIAARLSPERCSNAKRVDHTITKVSESSLLESTDPILNMFDS